MQEPELETTPASSTSRARKLRVLALVAALLAVILPPLVLRYLPMTDLPQHVAIVSILVNLDDPSLGFATWYELAFERTLYLLPYVLGVALSSVMTPKAAMHVVVALAVVAYPVGSWLFLRAANKPWYLALLALPFVYNRAFYWGFVHFLLAIGLALAALSIVISERKSWRSDVVLGVLCIAVVTTHLYGVLFLVGYLGTWAVMGDREPIRIRLPALIPAFVGGVVWTLLSAKAPPHGGYSYVPPLEKLVQIPDSILGGFSDRSELVLLAMFVVVFLVVSWDSIPWSWARWGRLSRQDRVVYVFVAIHLILYFALPMHTPTGKFIHFRHALMAALLLPLAATGTGVTRWPRLAPALLATLSICAVINTWSHLVRFDREARDFDQIVDEIPDRSRIVGLPFAPHGGVMKTWPYFHFPAYVQAEKGGVIENTFPRLFWNLPVGFKSSSGFPNTPGDLEWNPVTFGDNRYGHYFDVVIARMSAGTRLPRDFPFRSVTRHGRWHVFRRSPR